MGLAGAAVAQRDDVLAAQDIFAAGELEDEHLVEPGDSGEVERIEALHRREPRRPDTPLHRAALAVDQLQFDQPQQVAGMVDAIAGALAGNLVIFAQDRRQLQLLQVVGQ